MASSVVSRSLGISLACFALTLALAAGAGLGTWHPSTVAGFVPRCKACDDRSCVGTHLEGLVAEVLATACAVGFGDPVGPEPSSALARHISSPALELR